MRHTSSGFGILIAIPLVLASAACTDTGTGGAGTGNENDTQVAAGDTSGQTPDTSTPLPDTGTPEDRQDIEEADDGVLKLLFVEPAVGATKGGDVVTVAGGGFVEGEIQVYFGPSLGTNVFVISPTRLTCTVPPGEPGLADVRVSKPATDETAILELGFRYQSPILVTELIPADGHVTGGQPVTVRGSGFDRGVDSVLFGQRAAIDVVVVDDSTLQLTTPAASLAAFVDVRVTTVEGAAVFQKGFEYFETPRLDRVLPGSGPIAGGTEVRLEGAGFSANSVVRFGETLAQKASVESSSLIVAVTPAGAAGTVSVTVDAARGTGGLPQGFVYVDSASLPAVSLVLAQPAKGSAAGGTHVDLVAYGLPDKTDGIVARFDGVPAEVVAVDAANLRLTVISPPGEIGATDLAIETPNGNAALPAGYTYEKAFAILTIDPPSGPSVGGTPVTIFGKGFKPGASVRIGALPCSGVILEGEDKLRCTTAAGSPGIADVRIQQGPAEAVLPGGFVYTIPGVSLYSVSPAFGAQAGGTFVTLVGAGFEEPMAISFGGQLPTHVTRVSSTIITCRSPPGEVATISVSVAVGSTSSVLPDSFTYFDPLSQFGGTWGADVIGSVNVSVIDAQTGAPLPDAYVMLDVNPDTPYQGYTNQDGQITLSGPDVLGTQMISASKTGYESSSVIRFDATNVTVALTPIPPPSSGPPPPGATVSGRVYGLGKYVVAPAPKCDFKVQPDGQCQACKQSSDCLPAAPNCSPVGTGTHCTAACASDFDCLAGFACTPVGGSPQAQCLPSPGVRQARCFLSMFSLFDPLPDDETPNIVAEDGTYEIGSYLGEEAVICLGGFVDTTNPDTLSNFTPVVFGVARHINAVPGPNPDNDVTLDHPLQRSVTVRLDKPPYDPEIGLEYYAALLYWDFGSDGGFMHRSFQAIAYGGFDEPILTVPYQPASFTGDVYDARFQLLGMAIALQPDGSQLPASFTQLSNLKQIETGNAYRLEAGQWESIPNSISRTVRDVTGTSATDLWAVGDGGAILHAGGGGWALQASPTKEQLYGVHAFAKDDAWAVGDGGTILHFDGISWNPVAGAGQYDEPRAVWGKSPDDVWIVGGGWSGYWHWDGATLTESYAGAGDLRDVHGRGDTLIAVGAYGTIRQLENGVWTTKVSPTGDDLFGVHIASASLAFAVGQDGIILRWDGTTWIEVDSPTTRTLRSVWAISTTDIYAVGDAATLLHFDGTTWTEQTESGKTSYTALSTVWADPITGVGVALGTSEVLMGPMLQVPKGQSPEDGGTMANQHVSFQADPGVDAHFNYIAVTIPSPLGETPVWQITTKGDVFEFDLPDFENIEGTPGIGSGYRKLTIMRVYKEDFDIDNYDFSDLDTSRWRSWSADVTTFQK